MDKKRIWEIVASIFVAAIFLSSYAAFGSNSSSHNATTTLPAAQTFYATGQGTAAVSSYGSVLNINVSCSNTTGVASTLNSLLTSLEKNNSVSTFYSPQSSQIFVQAGSANAYGIYRYLYHGIGQNALCTTFLGQVNIKLPSSMTFYVPTQRTSVIVQVPQRLQGRSVQARLLPNATNTVNVIVSTLVTLNGTIYGNMSVIAA